MLKKERYRNILNWFQKNHPVAETELHYDSPFQLLIAVILSAQCTDRRVNMVAPPLFKAFPTPDKLAAATFDEVFPYVKSISYPNSKTKVIYKEPVIAVDTHVFRVSHRLGLSNGKTVEAVEKDLEANIPEDLRSIAHHWLILHGRYICTARAPKCADCPLAEWCRDYARKHIKIHSDSEN